MLTTIRSFETFKTEEKARNQARKEAAKTEKMGYPVFSLAVVEIEFEGTLRVNDWQVESNYSGQTIYTSVEKRWVYEITYNDPEITEPE